MSVQKVSDEMISGLNASKLTGAMPALDGSNLTGIDALPAVGSSGNVLTSDGANWASTAPAGGGGTALISRGDFSDVGTLSLISGIDNSTYDAYKIYLHAKNTNDNSGYFIQMSSNGGSSFITSSTSYKYRGMHQRGTSAPDYYSQDSGSSIQLTVGGVGNNWDEFYSSEITIIGAGASNTLTFVTQVAGYVRDTGDTVSLVTSGSVVGTHNAFRITAEGNMTGYYSLIGIKNS
jgi:hypothetical protein